MEVILINQHHLQVCLAQVFCQAKATESATYNHYSLQLISLDINAHNYFCFLYINYIYLLKILFFIKRNAWYSQKIRLQRYNFFMRRQKKMGRNMGLKLVAIVLILYSCK